MKKHLIYSLSLLLFGVINNSNAQVIYEPNSYKLDAQTFLKSPPLKISFLNATSPLMKEKGQTAKEKIENKPWFVSKFSVTGGGFFPINNTKVQVGASDGSTGTEIDFEDDLNLNKNTQTFLLGFSTHLGKRHKLEFNYFTIHRSSSGTLDKEIHFGDSIYPVNANVDAFFDTDILRFSYGYAFISNPKVEAGASFGFHLVKMNAGIAGQGNTQGFNAATDYGFTAPLPDFGLWGGYAFSQKWAVLGEIDYFQLKIEDIKGQIIGANLAVKYRAWERVGVTLGYTGFNFKIDMEKNSKKANLKWGYNGPSISVVYQMGTQGKGPL
ncbi:hypothetical protein [Solitalea lacus]|uniref:hypothetical protein n=1 Tax=Solitalea lacus TaxID=2911172 RepID=UPI001EDBD818|nr:hypothetical protein [Solitalea lacus]UKJ06305.1 hypothetical protein L2B55_12235 [Solitalea lacus]